MTQPVNDPVSDLETEVKAYAATLPDDIGEGLTITDCLLTNREVLYVCLVDEDNFEMEDGPEMRDAIKDGIAEWMEQESEDSDLHEMIMLCVQADRGIGFQYEGSRTDNTVAVHFTIDELSYLLEE